MVHPHSHADIEGIERIDGTVSQTAQSIFGSVGWDTNMKVRIGSPMYHRGEDLGT